METAKQWFENDDFWKTWQPAMFPPQRFQMAVDEVTKVLKLMGIPPGARIADIGCGPGRHSLELARRGFKVTGVDRTEYYLNQAGEAAAKEKLDAEFILKDMREFRRPGAFEAAINMFTTFGYFEDAEDDRRVVENVYDSLKPGGLFLVETHGKESMARVFRDKVWGEHEGVTVCQESSISHNWSHSNGHWILFKDGQRTEHRFFFRLYAATELEALFKSAGFKAVDIYGSLDGTPYDQAATRLVAVGHK